MSGVTTGTTTTAAGPLTTRLAARMRYAMAALGMAGTAARATTMVVGGGVLGASVAFVCSATMLEISKNRFFAIYFGLVFIIVGIVILARVAAAHATSRKLKAALMMLAIVVVGGGASCFVVDHNAARLGLSPAARIPFYVLISTTMAFAVTFGVIDVLNAAKGAGVAPAEESAWIRSPAQVAVILLASVVGGALEGVVFGAMDVEDASSHFWGLAKHDAVVVPLGFVGGAATAVVVRRMASPPSSSTSTNVAVAPVSNNNGQDEHVMMWESRSKRAMEGVGFDDGI